MKSLKPWHVVLIVGASVVVAAGLYEAACGAMGRTETEIEGVADVPAAGGESADRLTRAKKVRTARKIRLPLSVGEIVPLQETTALRLAVRARTNMSYTPCDKYGHPLVTVMEFDYKPKKDIEAQLTEAGFELKSEGEDATLFVEYAEQHEFDGQTHYALYYALYHRIFGRLLEVATKPGGCGSLDELRDETQLGDLADLIKASLAKGQGPRSAELEFPELQVNFEAGPIAAIPESLGEISHIVLSPDRRTVAYVAKKGDEQVIMVGQKRVDHFDALIGSLVFHPNGTSVGYTIKRDGAGFFAIDGQAGYAFDLVVGVHFSPDGEKYAYVALGDAGVFVVVNGETGEEFDNIPRKVSFSSNGDLAYWAFSERTFFLVVNGHKTATRWEDVTSPSFAPGGEVAYAAAREGRWFLVIGQQEQPLSIDGEVTAGPVFSPDGQRRAFVVRRDGGMFVSLDGRDMRKFEGSVGLPVFSQDGRHVAYSVEEDGSQFVVVDDRHGESYDKVLDPLIFSRDAQKISFGVRKGREIRLVEADIAGLAEVGPE